MGSRGNNFISILSSMCEGLNAHNVLRACPYVLWFGTAGEAVTGEKAGQGSRAQIFQGFGDGHVGGDHPHNCLLS